MSGKWERLAVALIVGLMMLWVVMVDYGDPTPAAIRWPLGVLAAAFLAWVAWRMGGDGPATP